MNQEIILGAKIQIMPLCNVHNKKQLWSSASSLVNVCLDRHDVLAKMSESLF